MKKPINKFAVVLWIVATAYALAGSWSFYTIMQLSGDIQHAYGGHAYFVVGTAQRYLEPLVVVFCELVALGLLIEMVDQIRWNLARRS